MKIPHAPQTRRGHEMVVGDGQLPRHTTSVSPWRHRGFRWFFTGQSVSLAGSAMTPVALSFAVLTAAHHSSDLAIVLAAQSLTLILFLLVGGAVADRLPRARVLVWSNLGAGLTQGAVAAQPRPNVLVVRRTTSSASVSTAGWPWPSPS